MKPMVKNAADEGQVTEASRRSKFKREDDLEDLRAVLAQPSGCRFLRRLLSECGVFKSSFTGSSETYFLEGQRNVGLKIIFDVIEADSKYLPQIMLEPKGE